MKNFLQYLTEATLNVSEDFTFGFEFEACLKKDSILFEESPEKIKSILTKDLTMNLKKEHIYSEDNCKFIERVIPSNHGEKALEYNSPAFLCTQENLKKVADCIEKWNSVDSPYALYTNETCNFRVHLKFFNMSQKDAIWIYANMAIDDAFIAKYTKFRGKVITPKRKQVGSRVINFDNNKTNNTNIGLMRQHVNGLIRRFKNHGSSESNPHLKSEDRYSYSGVSSVISHLFDAGDKRMGLNSKYGTIEWSGPKNFMNHNNNMNIQSFFKAIYEMAKDLSGYAKLKTLPGTEITKAEFLKKTMRHDANYTDSLPVDSGVDYE